MKTLLVSGEWLVHAKAWGVAVLIAMGSARAMLKPFNARLQRFLDRGVSYVRQHGDGEFNGRLDRVLASPVYLGISFVLDYVVSLKLPQRSAKASQPDAQQTTKMEGA